MWFASSYRKYLSCGQALSLMNSKTPQERGAYRGQSVTHHPMMLHSHLFDLCSVMTVYSAVSFNGG